MAKTKNPSLEIKKSEAKKNSEKIKFPVPEFNEYVWKNPKKINRTRFDFKYNQRQNKEEFLNVKRNSVFKNTLERLHLWLFN